MIELLVSGLFVFVAISLWLMIENKGNPRFLLWFVPLSLGLTVSIYVSYTTLLGKPKLEIPSQETSGRFFIYLPKEDRVRKLTINECFKIMGFDEDYKKVSTPGQLYKQIGNSVGTTVVSELARQILDQGMLTEDEAQKEIKRDSSKVVNKQTQLAL